MTAAGGAPARIAVAMSGGVDSAVAAHLLAASGHDLIGVTLKLFCYGDQPLGPKSCCSMGAIEDARKTCDRIGIPHHVVSFEERFSERVIDRFVEEYVSGRTPNPCVLCNQHVKITAFLETARGFGAEAIATGHHARVVETEDGPELLTGRDAAKDQTYALWAVPRAVLARTRMPVGALTKDEVRSIAREADLPVAEKAESQDICFVPRGRYDDVVTTRLTATGRSDALPATLGPGEIRDTRGRVLGEHGGVARYTIGQRRGLGVARGEPLYVVGLDAAANVVVVGSGDELGCRSFRAREANWVSIDGLDGERRVCAKIRYRDRGVPATVSVLGEDRLRVVLERPARAVTPGQSVVFYDGEVALGGAVIEAPERPGPSA